MNSVVAAHPAVLSVVSQQHFTSGTSVIHWTSPRMATDVIEVYRRGKRVYSENVAKTTGAAMLGMGKQKARGKR